MTQALAVPLELTVKRAPWQLPTIISLAFAFLRSLIVSLENSSKSSVERVHSLPLNGSYQGFSRKKNGAGNTFQVTPNSLGAFFACRSLLVAVALPGNCTEPAQIGTNQTSVTLTPAGLPFVLLERGLRALSLEMCDVTRSPRERSRRICR